MQLVAKFCNSLLTEVDSDAAAATGAAKEGMGTRLAGMIASFRGTATGGVREAK